MKEEMTTEQRNDLVAYYFERAHESVEEAKYLRDEGYYNNGATLADLFNQRQVSDYEAYAFRDASSVAYLLPKAEAFIEAVEELVQD